MDEDEKRDEEQEVRDTDADTRDVDDSEKRDEEQAVRDTDADTKDVDRRLDRIEEMISRLTGKLDKISDAQSVLVESGAIVDMEPDPTEDDGASAARDNDILDLTIND